jgi:DNA polymerase-4
MAEPVRKIIHVDMDAFFASIEQRDNPALRGQPVAVGRGGPRGVVAAASYEARPFGVRSAMPSVTARRLCPGLVFVRHRFDVYKQESRRIREIFARYTDLIEPLSLDEAYLDVTFNKIGLPSATLIAERIKADILAETGLTASAGVSYCKFLAKVASDLDKPDGLAVITPGEAEGFIDELPIGDFWGVGPRTEEKMKRHGITSGAELRARSEHELVALFGKSGRFYHGLARGVDAREVKPERIRKSVGAEETFPDDLTAPGEMLEHLEPIVAEVWERLGRHGTTGSTVTLKIKYSDFRQRSRSHTRDSLLRSEADLMEEVRRLLHTPEPPPDPVRLLGVVVSNLLGVHDRERGQLTLDL